MTKVEKFDLKSRQVDIFFITLDSSGNIFNVYLYIIVFVYYHLYIIYIIIILPLRVKCNASAQNGEIRYTKDRILPMSHLDICNQHDLTAATSISYFYYNFYTTYYYRYSRYDCMVWSNSTNLLHAAAELYRIQWYSETLLGFRALTLLRRRYLSYRNQSIDLLCKPMDWFLYDWDLRHESVNKINQEMVQEIHIIY